MSLFRPANLVCPNCEALIAMQAVGSVNADRRPDFRDAILDDDFQDVTCGSCGKSFRMQPQFNYLDVGRSQWIAGFPAMQMPEYLSFENEVAELFSSSYGAKAPKAAQEVGQALDVRLTFGWPAIREKIFARARKLDDVVLELLKLDVLRRLPEASLAPGIELRLVDFVAELDQLVFVWLESASETALQEVRVSMSAYNSIVENPEPWNGVRAILEDGAFVDMQKLYMGEGRKAM